MDKFRKIKEKFEFHWKQRKYNLSVFGKTAHRDWKIILVIIFFAFIFSSAYGYLNYKKIIAEMNTESEIVIEKSKKRELEQVGAFVSDLKLKEQKFLELSGQKLE